MLGWSIGFFVAALVAAVFGFGGIASAFAGIAVILFWVFVALLVISLLFGAFGGAAATTHGRSGGSVALIAIIAGVAILTYAWVKNDWSAQQVGAAVDHTASEVADNTSEALHDAGNRVEHVTNETTSEIRNDASKGLDDASDRVDTDNNHDN